MNERIRVREVRVLGAASEQLGGRRPEEALEKAREMSLLAIDEIIGNGLDAAMNKYNSDSE